MKILAIILMLLIFYNLGTALYYMIKDKGQTSRMAKSLSYRVGFSVLLFVIMMAVYRYEMLTN
ncbi:MAG: twin transmembrane helix small protein [Nitrosomonas sp.]|nr:twin transmembrane helix small protein [Nitrosomonas sp.]